MRRKKGQTKTLCCQEINEYSSIVHVDAEVVTPLVDGLLSVLIPIVMLGVEMHQGGWVLESVCSERREQAGHSMFDDLVS